MRSRQLEKSRKLEELDQLSNLERRRQQIKDEREIDRERERLRQLELEKINKLTERGIEKSYVDLESPEKETPVLNRKVIARFLYDSPNKFASRSPNKSIHSQSHSKSPNKSINKSLNKSRNGSPVYNNINPYIYAGKLKRTPPRKLNNNTYIQVNGEVDEFMIRYKNTVDKSQERYNKIRCVLQKCEKFAERNNDTFHLHHVNNGIKRNYSPPNREKINSPSVTEI